MVCDFAVARYGSDEEALARQKTLWGHGAAVHRPPHPAMHSMLRISAHQRESARVCVLRMIILLCCAPRYDWFAAPFEN